MEIPAKRTVCALAIKDGFFSETVVFEYTFVELAGLMCKTF